MMYKLQPLTHTDFVLFFWIEISTLIFSNEIFSNANNCCAALNFSLQPKWLQTDKWRMED